MNEFDFNTIEKRVRYRKLIFGSLFLALLLFSLVFAVSIQGRNALGDILLTRIGLKPWSEDNGGFHYTFLYALVMFTVGIFGSTYYLKSLFPKLIKRLPLIVFVLFLLLPSLTNTVIHTVRSFSGGLGAVEFEQNTSYCVYESDDYGNLLMTVSLKFHNYSNRTESFSVIILPDEQLVEDLLIEDRITANVTGTKDPIVINLGPHSDSSSTLYIRTRLKDGITDLKGTMSPLDIIIFNDKEEQAFIKMP